MKLLNKSSFYLFKNYVSLLSYSHHALTQSIYILRSKLMYLFFYLYKKSTLLHLAFKYKIYLGLSNICFANTVLDRLFMYQSVQSICLNNFFFYYRFFFSLFFLLLEEYQLFFILLPIKGNTLLQVLYSYDNLFYSYRKYNYIFYLWLFSIKYLKYYHGNISFIKRKVKQFVVLRSPHKDKTSKELFHIKKMKRNLSYPSFLSSDTHMMLLKHLNHSLLLKNKLFLYK